MKNLKVYEEVLIVVDMVNGFARGEGVLVSPLVEKIIPEVVEEVEKALENGKLVIFIKDTHEENDIEFKRFGWTKHCLRGTYEAELVEELVPLEEKGISFEKNCTSFMYAEGFVDTLDKLENIKTIDICGCCTDICDTNGVLPMMNYFDHKNRDIEVRLLADAMATFDAPNHNAEKYSEAAYLLMEQQGAKVLRKERN